MTAISRVFGRQILDSRGNPSVEVDVVLADGSSGRAAVPSGASTGANEAVEVRDGDPRRFHGKGVSRAVAAVNGEIAGAVTGLHAEEQALVDTTMIELDGTANKGRLGANAILGVSLATAKAAAQAHRQPLHRYLGGAGARLLPVPMMNIVNGGAHADNPLDFQEFMIAPVGAPTFFDAVRMGSEVFHTLRRQLAAAGHSTNVGDEGGFAPAFADADEALRFVVRAVEDTGYRPGADITVCLDPAASEFFHDGAYVYAGEKLTRTVDEHITYLLDLAGRYPISSGSLSRSDRTAKYNQLIRIEEELGRSVRYAGAR